MCIQLSALQTHKKSRAVRTVMSQGQTQVNKQHTLWTHDFVYIHTRLVAVLQHDDWKAQHCELW